MEHLNLRPHPAHRQPPPPKNIRRLIRNLMRGPRRKRLQQSNRTRQQHGLLRVRHAVHLMGEGLEPGLVGFDEGDEAGEFVPDEGLRDEGFGGDVALVGPEEAVG